MNNDWRNELENTNYECYIRLCECRNTRADLYTMSALVKKYNPTVDAEECVDYILEWVGDWNGQYNVTELTENQYKRLVNSVEKSVDK